MVTSPKENIPLEEAHQLVNEDKNKRSMSATETQTKSTSQVSSDSPKEVNRVTTEKNLLLIGDVPRYKIDNMDGKRVDIKKGESSIEDKV